METGNQEKVSCFLCPQYMQIIWQFVKCVKVKKKVI